MGFVYCQKYQKQNGSPQVELSVFCKWLRAWMVMVFVKTYYGWRVRVMSCLLLLWLITLFIQDVICQSFCCDQSTNLFAYKCTVLPLFGLDVFFLFSTVLIHIQVCLTHCAPKKFDALLFAVWFHYVVYPWVNLCRHVKCATFI